MYVWLSLVSDTIDNQSFQYEQPHEYLTEFQMLAMYH